MTPATDEDLGGPRSGPRAFVKLAETHGWWTAATVAAGVNEIGRREPTFERSLLLRGRRLDGRFVVQYLDGQAAGAWWWDRRQRVVVPDADGQTFDWVTERPTPHKVSASVLKDLLGGKLSWPDIERPARARKARSSAPATRKVRTDGVS